MEIACLKHKHGGDISSITHVQHETYKGVADWEFLGTVRWNDGSLQFEAHIPPFAICHDGSDEGIKEANKVFAVMSDYLNRAGEWHKQKSKRDGRVYSWTPHKTSGRELV